jgi:hypothetical protein
MSTAADTPYTPRQLRAENARFRHGGGVSRNNRQHGFLPAFVDRACFANGVPALLHLLDGLPDELVIDRDARGRVVAVSPCVEAGFLRVERFYSRQRAARMLA